MWYHCQLYINKIQCYDPILYPACGQLSRNIIGPQNNPKPDSIHSPTYSLKKLGLQFVKINSKLSIINKLENVWKYTNIHKKATQASKY